MSAKIPTLEEFDQLTHKIIWPVLEYLDYTEGPAIEGQWLYYYRIYSRIGVIIHVLYERGDDYTDIRVTNSGDENAGKNIVFVLKELGRSVDAYEKTRRGTLEDRYRGLATLMLTQAHDILDGSLRVD